jgi:hypothetical protein|tara:strand:- start:46 stop:225 length:180 start_codon:yes stop_codon:yes gene_type:complete
MIDIDKYEECSSPLLIAEVKRLREEVKYLHLEVNTLNEIIDTERMKVYNIAQRLLEVVG